MSGSVESPRRSTSPDASSGTLGAAKERAHAVVHRIARLAVVANVSAALACATPPSKNVASDSARDAGADADAGAGPRASAPAANVPSLDALAAWAAPDVASMTELTRAEIAGPRVGTVTLAYDACLRAAFGASRDVRAAFVDAEGAPRGPSITAARGLVPPRGPACGRKGETLALVASEDGAPDAAVALTRAIVWISPPRAAGP